MERVIRVIRGCIPVVMAVSLGFLETWPARAQNQNPTPKKQLTVDRIFSAPPLSGEVAEGIEWAPDGKAISYLEGGEIWTMDATTGERKALVSAETLRSVVQPEKQSSIQSTGLGRVEEQMYQWSPDSHWLLFVGTNSLALLDLRTNSAKPLVSFPDAISDPKFSPDSNWVSFVRSSNVWVVNIASEQAKPVTTGGSEELLKGQLDWVYPEELDCATAYWWSPDSAKIAYYIMDERRVTRYPILDMSSPIGEMQYTRYPQAGEANPIVRVAVVTLGSGESKTMDTGTDTDVYIPRVNWLPDSRRLAIQRLNRAQNHLICSLPTLQPAHRRPFQPKPTNTGAT